MKQIKRCEFCGCPLDMQRDFDIESCINLRLLQEQATEIYHAILDGRYRSIDLCNLHYALMKSLSLSLPSKEGKTE